MENLNAKRLNKLEVEAGQDLLGELVSVVSHRGDVNAGHFVSYHQVQNNWYLNNDPVLLQKIPLMDPISYQQKL